MKLTEQINQIIDRRIGRNGYEGQGHLEVIKRQKAFFDEVGHLIDDYSTLRATILSQIKEQKGEYYVISMEDPAFLDKVELADPSSFILQLQKCQKECERLTKRFNRDTINISVVGRARQGKSRLLQSISGLPNEIIPADDGGDCTGAKSVISNSQGPTYAEVIFYTEMEIVEAVNDYLLALDSGISIGSVNQIPSIDIDRIEQGITSGTDKTSLLGHLKKYVEHYNSYAKLLGSTLVVNKPSEIRRYTSQYLTNNEKIYEYLGVKEVKIYTAFNYADAGKIQLVDTIGLFDTALGLEKKMMNTLADESDAAILLRLPNAMGDHVDEHDNKLYNDIENKLGAETLNMWLFYVLNVWDTNTKSGAFMYEQLKEQYGKTLRASFVKQVNCADQNEVEKEIVIPILETLSANLNDIDRKLISSANNQFANAYASYFELCRKVQNVLNDSMKQFTNTGGLFDELYDKLNLSTALKKLNKKYSDINETDCVQLLDDIRGITRRLSDFVPSEDEIAEQIAKGDINADYSTVYNHCAHYLRSVISDEFETVTNQTLITLQEQLKHEILQILRSNEGGKLNAIHLMNADDSTPDKDWAEEMISEKLENYPILAGALRYIADYRINMEGLIEYRINKCLSILDPSNEQILSIDWSKIESEEEAVEYIEQTLLNAIGTFSGNLLNSLSEILAIPYNSFDTRVRKFREKIIFSKEGQKELRNLYRENCALIWHDEFASEIKRQEAAGDWSKYADDLTAMCKKERFVV